MGQAKVQICFCNIVAIPYTKLMEITAQKLRSTLKTANYSATTSRLEVFTKLAAHGPLSVGELARTVGPGTDRATVYRTVELFEKLGIINRIWHGFKHQIELSEIFTPHHHHAVCQNCGQTLDITSPELESTLAKIAKEQGFLAISHSVELIGYCQRCH
jgi:Fur family ferric uptake transcriptional regulator